MRDYTELINRKQAEYGEKFDTSELSQQFVRYYNNGQRIKVKTRWDEELTGTIGVTTGWKPVFLLMRTSRSIGSSTTLTNEDKIIAGKVGNVYRSI